jgi:hypothetical protein
MDMSNTSPSNEEIAAKMDKRADDYLHNPTQHVILNPYQSSILKLRAKYATYESITSMLNEEGVKVSEATVRKFCRTHQQEVKRLRAEHDRKRRETPAPSNSRSEDRNSSSSTEPAGRPLTTSEANRPGPKIARERL